MTAGVVQMDQALYERVLAALPDDGTTLRAEVLDLSLGDWCEDDGAGYCGNHDAWVAYHVDRLGPGGKVLGPGTFDPQEVGFAICTSAYHYDAALDR